MPYKDEEARRAANRRAYERRRDSGYQREYMREFYAKRKLRVMELKADRACLLCGFDDPRALEFHHRDPSQKKFKISEEAWKASWERVLEEVEKCDVLCSNCHRIKHFDDPKPGRPRIY